MGAIYENSACTIAAATALNSHQGCFVGRNPLCCNRVKIAETQQDELYAQTRPLLDYKEVSEGPWAGRGWVFQETLLSRRILIFGRGLFWTCRKGQASEEDPEGRGTFTMLIYYGPKTSRIFQNILPTQLEIHSPRQQTSSSIIGSKELDENNKTPHPLPPISASLGDMNMDVSVKNLHAKSTGRPSDRLNEMQRQTELFELEAGVEPVYGNYIDKLSYVGLENWTGIPAGRHSFLAFQQEYSQRPTGAMALYREWMGVVRAYTTMQLTRTEDRLVALSGIAQKVQELDGSEYLAGIWIKPLPLGLLWKSVKESLSYQRPSRYQAPTWSWASIEDPVDSYALSLSSNFGSGEYNAIKLVSQVASIETTCDPSDITRTGQVSNGKLVVKGVLYSSNLHFGGENREVYGYKYLLGNRHLEFEVDPDTQAIPAERVYLLPVLEKRKVQKKLVRSCIVYGLVLVKREGYFERCAGFEGALTNVSVPDLYSLFILRYLITCASFSDCGISDADYHVSLRFDELVNATPWALR